MKDNKPRILIDIRKQGFERIYNLPKRVDTRLTRVFLIPFSSFGKAAVIVFAFSSLIFGSALAPVGYNQLSLAAQTDEERQQLEKQLEELEGQISEYQATVDKYKGQGKGLKDEIARLNANINKLNLQIKSVNLSLQKLGQDLV